jgi:uncharacterized metal-binding protein
MPNYKTHDRIGLMTTPLVGAAALIVSVEAAIITSIAYLLSTFFLSPDLDLRSRIYKRWGILRWYWYPYQVIIPHRSFWSHSGIVSGTVRFLYLTVPLTCAILFVDATLLENLNLNIVLYCYIGVVLADVVHTVADWSLHGE